jgi:hypothetical protein
MLCWLIGAKECPDETPTTGDDANVCSSYATCLTGFHQMRHWIWMNGVLVIHLNKRKLARTHIVQEIVALRQQMQGTSSTTSMFTRTTFHAHQ